MQIDIITLFPQMFTALDSGIVGRAQHQQRLQLCYYPLRQYSSDSSGRIDDRPYGGGPGMVMQYQPLARAINEAKSATSGIPTTVIYLSPQGKLLQQSSLTKLSQRQRLTIVCGRYEGIDERLIDNLIDEEWSIGDYVVSGGELPAMILIDAITRLLPGVLGDDQSVVQDSFTTGLLDWPQYTRPAIVDSHRVPSALLSGNHKTIQQWRQQQALIKTWQKRPDLLKRRTLTEEEQQWLDSYLQAALGTEE